MQASTAEPFDEIVTADWPMVQIRIRRAPVHDSEIDAFQARFIAILAEAQDQKERIFLLFNLDGIVQATLAQQFRAGGLIRDVRSYVATSIAATGLVVTSNLARTILRMVMALQPLTSVNSVFDCEDDAAAWLAANRARVEAGSDPIVDVFGESGLTGAEEVTEASAVEAA